MTVVYGTVCLDRTYSLPHLPERGGYVELLAERVSLGGEAANTAAAILRWRGNAVLVGNPIGTGDEAEMLELLLEANGVGDALMPAGEHPAPVCHIMVTPDGERTMFGRGFQEMETRGDPSLIPFNSGDWFTADPNHGSLARKALVMAHGAGMRTYALDFVRDDEDLPSGCFWQSSTSWVGKSGDLGGNIAWLSRWIEKHDCTAILTDGGHGFLLGDRKRGVRSFPVWPIEHVVDSTGAGDTFRAGMLFGLDQLWPLAECLIFASAAAALSCQGMGALGGLTQRGAVEELIHTHEESADLYRQTV